MPTVLLVRHGRTPANASGVLAGRAPGIGLDDAGQAQAREVGGRLAGVELVAVMSSPLDRCVETAEAIAAHQKVAVTTDARLTECGYGSWTGRPLKELARTSLWRRVQNHPSSVEFPGGESLAGMQARAVEAIRELDAHMADRAGRHAVWAAVSHGDVIKAITADALGMHLDLFQRLVVDPGSVTIIQFGPDRPFVVRTNDTGSDLSALGRRRRHGPAKDAVVGGGSGSE